MGIFIQLGFIDAINVDRGAIVRHDALQLLVEFEALSVLVQSPCFHPGLVGVLSVDSRTGSTVEEKVVEDLVEYRYANSRG